MAERNITVIGSLNMDFQTRTPRIPEPGETLTAASFSTGFGGKGANQAVACARLAPNHVKVSMVGNVGDDIFGRDYLEGLTKEGIDVRDVRKLEGQRTGAAIIIVDEASGENRILFTANANYAFSEEESEEWKLVPKGADVVVFQLEIPLRVVCSFHVFDVEVDVDVAIGVAQHASGQREWEACHHESGSSFDATGLRIPGHRHSRYERDRVEDPRRPWRSRHDAPQATT